MIYHISAEDKQVPHRLFRFSGGGGGNCCNTEKSH